MTASRKNRILLALAIVALAQTGVLAGMVVDRARLLKTGPRDHPADRPGRSARSVPRRIRAARLRHQHACRRMLLEGPPPARNAAFYVTLEKKPDGAWTPVKVAPPCPARPSPTASC